ncbi:DEAD/DEAH box helicase [Olsenella sp. YH-ols2223]|uniref:Protein translocase subunit SecA n=1 Tax=Olsenella absiana TaxID=3115222 RepID=A0ABU7RB94_9ACTN
MMTRRLRRTAEAVRACAGRARGLSDEELSAETARLRAELASGRKLDELLPEAFAAMAEADRRVLGTYPYDEQVLGAVALEAGCLAEMRTGEGKTLTATLPLYLHALTGRSTILVTANEYLAYRDAEQMRPAFAFMGVTERAGVGRTPGQALTNDEKRANYAADVLYTTHSVLAFDYLLNNLVARAEDRFLRDFDFVLIDEADSVLLDGAQMPLVISGSPRVQSDLYPSADFFVSTLREGRDFEVEDKACWLTEAGVAYAERFFGVPNLFARESFELNRHILLALRARSLFERERDYVISDKGEVVLLDNTTGRLLPGMRLRGGVHQALEQKEHLELSREQRSVASITYQNLFLLFPEMCGMSGTFADARAELRSVYGKRVFVVPPHRPLARTDLPDLYFRSAEDQYAAALASALAYHRTGQPVLVVTATIQDTQVFSRMLVERHVPHNVLNANNAYWEAQIIAAAGQRGAVTVSTGMAGRGTDIRLGEGARELGGLAVIGVGRMENTRLERQARGRAGRQGDPGSSQFFVSLEDGIVTQLYEEKVDRILDGGRRASRRRIRSIVDGAQRTMEEQSVSSREQAVRYDRILRRQREILYAARDRLLDGDAVAEGKVLSIAHENLKRYVREHPRPTQGELNRYVLDNLTYELDPAELAADGRATSRAALLGRLEALADRLYEEKAASFSSDEELQDFTRACMLRALDEGWVEEVDYLQQLQYAITSRGTAQRNPLFEYSREAYRSFHDMERTMMEAIARNFFLAEPQVTSDGTRTILFP